MKNTDKETEGISKQVSKRFG